MTAFITPIIIGIVIILVSCIRQINQYERGLLFNRGKYSKMLSPGWTIIIPVFQSLTKVDIRIKAIDVPDQEALTRDNIPVHINAVIYYKVLDSAKAILEIENYNYATSQLAQTTMRNIVGEYSLDQLLQDRHAIAEKIKEIVDKASDPWGIDVQTVELKDIILPEKLKRTLAKVAEAEREKKAVIVISEGEVGAAKNMAEAAKTLATSPGALHLRTLQTVNDLSSDQSNTTIWMLPIEAIKAVEGIQKHLNNK